MVAKSRQLQSRLDNVIATTLSSNPCPRRRVLRAVLSALVFHRLINSPLSTIPTPFSYERTEERERERERSQRGLLKLIHSTTRRQEEKERERRKRRQSRACRFAKDSTAANSLREFNTRKLTQWQRENKKSNGAPLKTNEGIHRWRAIPWQPLQGGPRSSQPRVHELAKGRGFGRGEVRWARRTAICGAILVG